MPLQNRVGPCGEIVAVAARGLFMGNRGVLHDDCRRLRARRWALKAWLICRLEFRGRRRAVMAPRRYTELFFFDEATAIAAGHRPCYECRRKDFAAWQAAWARAFDAEATPRAKAIDARLHGERVDRKTRAQRRWMEALDELPDGAFVAIDGAAHLVWGDALLAWSWAGYGAPRRRAATGPVVVLTPPSAVATLRVGYRPVLHSSAATL